MGFRGAYGFALAAALLVAAECAFASSGGISGFSGNPNTFSGGTCSGSCHTAGTRTYTPSFSGALATVAPSATDVLSFVLTNGGTAAPEAGFDLSLRRLTGSGSAGSLTAGSGQRVTSVAGGDSFDGELTHSAPQTTSGGNASWSFTFNAPANVGTVRMHACGNPVDNNANSTGNDGPAACTSRDVTINSTPSAIDDSRTVAEDSGGTAFSLMSNDFSGAGSVNDGGDSVTITNVTNPPNGSATITGGGTTVTYTPDLNYAGGDSFTYTVTDSIGATDTGSVSVNVTAVNDAPVANDDSVSVDRNSSNNSVPAAGTVLTNDTDVDSAMNVTLVNGSSATGVAIATTHGTVTRSGNALTYTPVAGYSGADSFDYTVSDGFLTDVGTVSITVNAVAIPDSAMVNEDSVNNSINVLSNDALADASTKTIVSVTAPNQGGTAVIFGTVPNEQIRYTPATNFSGIETFTYTMTDNSAVQDSALVTVTVTAINDAPVINAIADTSANADAAFSQQATVIDPDDSGAGLSFSLPTAPAGAAVSAAGLVTWTPPCAAPPDVASYNASFVVRVADGGENGAAPDTEAFLVAVDQDADNDGMSNCFENDHPSVLDPADPSDAGEDPDRDGLSNLEEYQQGLDPATDDVAPVLNVPADLVVTSTGYLTFVDLGTATATDGRDGAVTPVTNWTFPVVRPGRYVVGWTATDQAGNQAAGTQNVDVLPLVELQGLPAVAGEGGPAAVLAVLNGDAPEYPVQIPFTVGGTAGPADSDAVDGTITINGGTVGLLFISITDDGVPEPAETLVVTATSATNAALGNHASVTIPIGAANVPPQIFSLTGVQNGLPRFTAYTGDGLYGLNVDAFDGNGDPRTYNWSGSDNALGIDADLTSAPNFDPSSMTPGAYTAHVQVSDGNGGTATASVLLLIASGTSTDSDVDSDGIPDSADAVTDYGAVLSDQAGDLATDALLETDPQYSLRRGRTSLAAGRTGALITMSDIVTFGVGGGGLPLGADSLDNLGGIFDFEVHGLNPGDTARVVLPLQTAIRAGAVYRKFDPASGWHDFVEGGIL